MYVNIKIKSRFDKRNSRKHRLGNTASHAAMLAELGSAQQRTTPASWTPWARLRPQHCRCAAQHRVRSLRCLLPLAGMAQTRRRSYLATPLALATTLACRQAGHFGPTARLRTPGASTP